jgi:hypothetical protein
VLVGVVERFLEREIALRERIDGVDFLVFPSQYQREAPFPGTTSYGIRYDFSGAMESVFATLVVRLAHHTGFRDRDFYRNAARYEATDGGRCLILFEDQGDGRGRMSVFFEDNAPDSVQQMFLQYVYTHLQRKALPGSIVRKRAYHCPACGYLFDDEVVDRRLHRGDDEITCSDCDTRSPLYDLLLTDEDLHRETIGHIDADARAAMHRQLAVSAIQGKKRAGRFDVAVLYGEPDRAHALWLSEALQSLGLRVWLDVWQHDSSRSWSDTLEQALPQHVRSVIACVGEAAPWSDPATLESADLLRERAAQCVLATIETLRQYMGLKNVPAEFGEYRQFSLGVSVLGDHLGTAGEEWTLPFARFVTVITGRTREGIDILHHASEALEHKAKESRERRSATAARPDASVIVTFSIPTLGANRGQGWKLAIDRLVESLRVQLAEVIGAPAEFVTTERTIAKSRRAEFRFAAAEDVLRLFAMIRTRDSFMADVLERWSIDVEQFQRDNETVEAEVRRRLRPPNVGIAISHWDIEPSPAPRLNCHRVELSNFRCFEHLELDLNRESSLEGCWTCLAGINGSGKTSVLQAICLALVGKTTAIDIGLGILARTQRLAEGSPQPTDVEVTFSDGQKHVFRQGLTIDGDDIRTTGQHSHPWLVLAYGATRNLSDRPDRSSSNEGITARRQMTLFDPYARVASAKTALDFVNPNEPFFGLFSGLLKQLFPDDLRFELRVGAPRFRVENESVTAIDLPDGFRSSVAWLADLCHAWCEENPDVAKKAKPSDIEAVVLIDEIDLHLHPSLQRTLVPALRKALPKVQWIVTTHSPLVLSCFDKNEIIALDRSEPGGVRHLDRQIMGFSVDEIIEWLMGTDATSAVMEERLAEAERSRDAVTRDIAEVLRQSRDANESEARQRLDDLASQLDQLEP